MDAGVLIALQSMRVEGLTEFMALLSALGEYAFVWVVIAVLMLFFQRDRAAGFTILLTLAATGLIVDVALSNIIGRERPCDAGIGVTAVMGVSRSGFSCPSFYAASAAASVVIMARLRGGVVAVPSGVLAFAIVFARMFCGVSWPSDILAGAVVGIVVGLLASTLAKGAYYSVSGMDISELRQRRRDTVGGGKHSRY